MSRWREMALKLLKKLSGLENEVPVPGIPAGANQVILEYIVIV